MRVVVQRCTSANIVIDNKEKRSIEEGFVVYLGLTHNDDIKDIKGSIMLVSQFTLYANTKKGNRPSFEKSMKFEDAKELYNTFIEEFKKQDINFVTGEFGSYMKVSYTNDGPVTIIIDSKEDL